MTVFIGNFMRDMHDQIENFKVRIRARICVAQDPDLSRLLKKVAILR